MNELKDMYLKQQQQQYPQIQTGDDEDQLHFINGKVKKKKKRKARRLVDNQPINNNDYSADEGGLQDQHLENQWQQVNDFKPRKNYELPTSPKDPNIRLLPNDHKHVPYQANKNVQQVNDYLMSRVNDQNYQKQLKENQYRNQV